MAAWLTAVRHSPGRSPPRSFQMRSLTLAPRCTSSLHHVQVTAFAGAHQRILVARHDLVDVGALVQQQRRNLEAARDTRPGSTDCRRPRPPGWRPRPASIRRRTIRMSPRRRGGDQRAAIAVDRGVDVGAGGDDLVDLVRGRRSSTASNRARSRARGRGARVDLPRQWPGRVTSTAGSSRPADHGTLPSTRRDGGERRHAHDDHGGDADGAGGDERSRPAAALRRSRAARVTRADRSLRLAMPSRGCAALADRRCASTTSCSA